MLDKTKEVIVKEWLKELPKEHPLNPLHQSLVVLKHLERADFYPEVIELIYPLASAPTPEGKASVITAMAWILKQIPNVIQTALENTY